jgi:hypothetical protein
VFGKAYVFEIDERMSVILARERAIYGIDSEQADREFTAGRRPLLA